MLAATAFVADLKFSEARLAPTGLFSTEPRAKPEQGTQAGGDDPSQRTRVDPRHLLQRFVHARGRGV